jgi:glycosyltransferase involved in cell wall biosynthesis
VATLEAMAAGRVVVAHVSDHARTVIRDATGAEVPVVQARADTLEEVVRGIIADPAASRATAAAGRDFVTAFHDGRRTAAVLDPFLGRAADRRATRGEP